MANTSTGREACHEVLAQLDLYLDDGLASDGAAGIAQHLEYCESCRSEAELRSQFLSRFRAAAKQTEAPAYLETRIRARLRERERRGKFAWKAVWAAAGSMAAICLCAALAYQLGHLGLTVKSQEAYITTISNQVPTIMRVGLGDHIHCSVFRKFLVNPPSMEQFVSNLGSDYSNVIPVVRQAAPEDFRIVMAHRCRYHGRAFVHLALKSGSRLLSLVIASKGDGEAFTTEQLAPALMESGIPVYQSGARSVSRSRHSRAASGLFT